MWPFIDPWCHRCPKSSCVEVEGASFGYKLLLQIERLQHLNASYCGSLKTITPKFFNSWQFTTPLLLLVYIVHNSLKNRKEVDKTIMKEQVLKNWALLKYPKEHKMLCFWEKSCIWNKKNYQNVIKQNFF